MLTIWRTTFVCEREQINKTGKKSKKILIVLQMPFHSHLNLVIRYFQDAGINILR